VVASLAKQLVLECHLFRMEKHSSLPDVARMMRENYCGAVPVVDDDASSNYLVGIVSDRDIVVRSVADGADPSKRTAGDCMTVP